MAFWTASFFYRDPQKHPYAHDHQTREKMQSSHQTSQATAHLLQVTWLNSAFKLWLNLSCQTKTV